MDRPQRFGLDEKVESGNARGEGKCGQKDAEECPLFGYGWCDEACDSRTAEDGDPRPDPAYTR